MKPQLNSLFAIVITAAALSGLAASRVASALEYQELEVYTHQMDGEGSMEIENLTSFSNTNKGVDNVMRSSLEFNYGVTNNFEVAAYTDFNYTATNNLALAEVRLRGRYSFFEQNQLPVDLGAYLELGFPRGEENKMEGEFRLIASKDVDRFTFSVNPTVIRPLVVSNGASTDFAWGASTSVAYRVDSHWTPHVDMFGQLGEEGGDGDGAGNQLLLVPAVDYRVSRHLAVGGRVGFGLTDATERQLAAVRLEYEL